MSLEKYKIDYKTFKTMSLDLCKVLLPAIDYDRYSGVIAVLRGGMYLADYVSRKFNLPLFYYEVSSYTFENKQGELISGISSELPPSNYILCDDIYDTGKTIDHIIKRFPDSLFCPVTLVSKQKNIPALYHTLIEDDYVWVEFPWEEVE